MDKSNLLLYVRIIVDSCNPSIVQVSYAYGIILVQMRRMHSSNIGYVRLASILGYFRILFIERFTLELCVSVSSNTV